MAPASMQQFLLSFDFSIFISIYVLCLAFFQVFSLKGQFYFRRAFSIIQNSVRFDTPHTHRDTDTLSESWESSARTKRLFCQPTSYWSQFAIAPRLRINCECVCVFVWIAFHMVTAARRRRMRLSVDAVWKTFAFGFSIAKALKTTLLPNNIWFHPHSGLQLCTQLCQVIPL